MKIKNKKLKIKVILLCILGLALLPSPGVAHKVNIFAYAEGHTVYTESYFPDGRKVEGGKVVVYDSLENKLLEGVTNKEGQFNFKIPKMDDLNITLLASMGHKNTYVLEKEELAEGREQKSEDKKNIEDRDKKIDRKKEDRGQKIEKIDMEQLKRIINASLDERLKPIMQKLKKQKEVSFREIIGGIGYIFGIFGLILFFISRKNLPPRHQDTKKGK